MADMQMENIAPPSNVIDGSGFKLAHEKFLEWCKTEEGIKILTREAEKGNETAREILAEQ